MNRSTLPALAAGLTLTALAGPTLAQMAPPPPPPPAPGHHFGFGRPRGGSFGFQGQIIGNKRTHVFHVAGDKSALPAPQNRVYFHSTEEAQRAGYRAAGSGGRGPRMQGSPVAGNTAGMVPQSRRGPRMQGSPRRGMHGLMGRPQPPRPLPGSALPPPPPVR